MHNQKFGNLGVGITSVLFVSRLITTNAIFTPALLTISYSLLAGPVFALLGALAFITFGVIGKRVMGKQGSSIHSFRDLIISKFKGEQTKTLFLFIGIGYLIDFLLLSIGASIILYAGFHIPIIIGVIIFISAGFPLVLIKSTKHLEKYTIYRIGLFFMIVIIMLVHTFLSSNLEEMFKGMRLFHPYLFAIQPKTLGILSIGFFIILLGKTVSDFGTWNLLFRIKKAKIQQCFLITGLIWATIPLSFSIMIYPALYQSGFHYLHTIFYDLLHLCQSTIFLYPFTLILFTSLLATFYTKLHEFLLFFNKETKGMSKLGFSITIFLSLCFVYMIFKPTILDLFFGIGILYTALLLPILAVLFSSNVIFSSKASFTILLSALIGYTSMLSFKEPISILITFISSLLLLSFFYLFQRMKISTDEKM